MKLTDNNQQRLFTWLYFGGQRSRSHSHTLVQVCGGDWWSHPHRCWGIEVHIV